ncbi:MAG: DUF368 domain-containing protein [Bacilli bacterium]|nr:DUF368 domain-containing protein [Bacilli bacterium]MDD4282313.1 DUF368 domain-containing protein [Bacilli bacterium]MDD4718317.1 DUF368 domain-containing protein [Bacilli bacterium]
MKNFILFLKGVIIGIGKIIPGLSGSLIMMILGLYEKGINSICNFFDDVVENTKFLVIIGSGILLSISLMSKLIKIALNNYYFLIMCFFIGLILGGIPSIFKKVKRTYNKSNIILFIICFFIVTSLSFIDNKQSTLVMDTSNILLLFIIGVIEAATMIIPGISGTAVLMAFGLYNVLLDVFINLSNLSLILYNLKTIIPFTFGIIIGGLFFIKLMNYVLTKYNTKTYWAITAFSVSSVVLMFNKTLENNYPLPEIILGIILLVIGYIGTRLFEIKFNR